MMRSAVLFISTATTVAVAGVIPRQDNGGTTVWATPHQSYSSSVGVLGCKIDTNRVAYWPASISCDNICIELSYQDRTVNLLRIDQSGGAYDVSYDAWNYLYTGSSATEGPVYGGPTEMTYRDVDASNCADLMHTDGHKLAFSAANSMNFIAECLQKPDSWVARNHVLYNIADPICTMGLDEQCSLDWPAANTPTCPNQLGVQDRLEGAPVYNLQYGTGARLLAGAPIQPASSAAPPMAATEQNGTAGGVFRESIDKSPYKMLMLLASMLVSALRSS